MIGSTVSGTRGGWSIGMLGFVEYVYGPQVEETVAR